LPWAELRIAGGEDQVSFISLTYAPTGSSMRLNSELITALIDWTTWKHGTHYKNAKTEVMIDSAGIGTFVVEETVDEIMKMLVDEAGVID
jgi:hypothetical protein